jgi:hypothetical protein
MKNWLNPKAGWACMLLGTVLATAPVHAQNDAVLTVGTETVSISDFEHIFLKNNRDSVITQEALDEYMELFINFKLKVQAAEALGMDTGGDLPKRIGRVPHAVGPPLFDQQRIAR